MLHFGFFCTRNTVLPPVSSQLTQYRLSIVGKAGAFFPASGSHRQGADRLITETNSTVFNPILWLEVLTWLTSNAHIQASLSLSVSLAFSLPLRHWWCSHTHTPVARLQLLPYWHPVNSLHAAWACSDTSYWWDHSQWIRRKGPV